MKPVFISNNKLFYSAMLIICLGIIVVGINYNKQQEEKIHESNKKMQNVLSVVKKIDNIKNDNVKKNIKKPVQKKKKTLTKAKTTLAVKNEESYFDNYKIERDRTRDREIELLREIINNPHSEKVTRQDAQSKLISITQNLEKEMDIENIIKANGFSNSVVFIHKTGVTVIMQNLNLGKTEVEKVKTKVNEIVTLVTGFKKETIQILFKK